MKLYLCTFEGEAADILKNGFVNVRYYDGDEGSGAPGVFVYDTPDGIGDDGWDTLEITVEETEGELLPYLKRPGFWFLNTSLLDRATVRLLEIEPDPDDVTLIHRFIEQEIAPKHRYPSHEIEFVKASAERWLRRYPQKG